LHLGKQKMKQLQELRHVLEVVHQILAMLYRNPPLTAYLGLVIISAFGFILVRFRQRRSSGSQ